MEPRRFALRFTPCRDVVLLLDDGPFGKFAIGSAG
jgi:hypothetical protein